MMNLNLSEILIVLEKILNNEYFKEKTKLIKDKYSDSPASVVGKDLAFCRSIFEDTINKKISIFKMNDWVRSGMNDGDTELGNDRIYFINLYLNFVENSMKDDDSADMAIELGGLNIFTMDFNSYFSDKSYYSKNSVIYKSCGELRSDEFLSSLNPYAVCHIIEHAIKIKDVSIIAELSENKSFDKVRSDDGVMKLTRVLEKLSKPKKTFEPSPSP